MSKKLYDYYGKNVIVTRKSGNSLKGFVTLVWDEDDDDEGAGIGLTPALDSKAGDLVYEKEIENISEV